MRRTDSYEKTLMLGKIEGGMRRGLQRVRCLDVIRDSNDMSLSRLHETVTDREDRCAAVHGSQRVGHHCVTEQQQKGKKMIIYLKCAHIIPINLKTRQHYIPYSMEKFEIHGNQVTCSSFMVLMVSELGSNSGCFHWTSMQLLYFYLLLFGWVLRLQGSGTGAGGYFTEEVPSKWSFKVE